MSIIAASLVENTPELSRDSVLRVANLDRHPDRKLRRSAQEGVENLPAIRGKTPSEFLAKAGHLCSEKSC